MSAVGKLTGWVGLEESRKLSLMRRRGSTIGAGVLFPPLFLHPFFTPPPPRQVNEDEL